MANIVIADDDPIISQLACELLIADGHACGWVSDGEKALELIRWRRPDLLLLDQHMPGKSGSDLLRELRGSPDHYDLPVIMFTGVTGREDELQARYNGAQDYIRKPIDTERLLFTVRDVLDSRADRPKHLPLEQYHRMVSGLLKTDRENGRSLA